MTNAGDTAPSVNPSRNRTVAKPAKFFGAARHMHTVPHKMTVAPTNFVRGNLDIR